MARVRLTPSASVTPTDVGVVLRSDLGMFRLSGRDVTSFISDMLPLLDGAHDRDAVATVLGGYSRQSVLAFLDLLEQHGLLETVLEDQDSWEDERWRGQEEFFRKWTDRPDEAVRRLRNARILIAGLEPWGAVAAGELAAAGAGALHLLDDGEVGKDDLLSVRSWSDRHLGRPRREALMEVSTEASPWCRVTSGPLELSDSGQLRVDGADWDLIVGALTADEMRLLYSVARFAHQAGITSLTGQLDGLDAMVGPVVVPGQTACWNCWRLRQLANAEHPETAHALQTSLLSQRPTRRTHTYLAPMAATLGHLLALEALKLVACYTPSALVGRLLIQNLVTLETTVHTAVRMPWCEVCGGAGESGTPPGGAVLDAVGEAKRSEVASGPFEELSNPEDLRRALAGWVDHRAGVIRHLLVDVPDVREPELPVTSTAVLASHMQGIGTAEGPEMTSGKGLSATEAMISAVGEAIERYSAGWYERSRLHRSSFNRLQGEGLDPRRLCLYTEAQYHEPDFPFSRFDPDQPIEWTRGCWLDGGEPVWLPALPTYFNFQVCRQEQFCQVTSNGLAAGARLDDACLRAVCELVERDAFMLTWLGRRPGQKILPDGTLDLGTHEVMRQLTEWGVQVELYLLEAGISIPTVVCLGLGDGQHYPGVTVALAAHPSPRIAVRKAVLEQGQVGPYTRRLMLRAEHAIPRCPEEVRTLTDHALYYVPRERAELFDFLRNGGGDSVPLAALAEPEDVSLRICKERLQEAGVRVAIADLTAPDVATGPFRVVRALGEDLQPIDFGFTVRRLANPRLDAMLSGEVNPYPHPLA